MKRFQPVRIGSTITLLVCSVAAFAEMKPPQPGDTSRYECTGPYGQVREAVVASVEGDNVRVDVTVDGTPQYYMKKYWTLPTTIADERQRNDGQGLRKSKYNESKIKGLAKMETGWEFNDIVREKVGNKKPTAWRYRIRIGEHKRVDHPVLGSVEVVEITEKREVIRGSYASTMVAQYVPEQAVSIGWTYRDREGTHECELVSHAS